MRDRHLDSLLARYVPSDERERGYVGRMRELLRGEAPASAFDRARYAPGHFTASAFVLSPERDALLLVFHKKLRIWVQPGGHVDAGDADLEAAATREVEEETGVRELERGLGASIFDVDIHPIPARKAEPSHEHFDVRFAFVARSRALVASDEVKGSRWVELGSVERANSDASVTRAALKLSALAR